MILGLRLYLLIGLIGHKALWEYYKRKQGGGLSGSSSRPLRVRLVKLGKMAILAGVAAQTLVPDGWIRPLLMFDEPAMFRVLGVGVYTLGLLVAILGRTQLGDNWSDIETAQVLEKQAVVSRGVYKFIRHPIYVGDLALLFGLELALNSWLVLAVILLTPIVLRQAIKEETLLRERLDGYDAYCAVTKRFIPYIA